MYIISRRWGIGETKRQYKVMPALRAPEYSLSAYMYSWCSKSEGGDNKGSGLNTEEQLGY